MAIEGRIQLIDIDCPDCGAHMTLNAAKDEAVCEYCGHKFLIQEIKGHIKMKEPEKESEPVQEEKLTETEKFIRERNEQKSTLPRSTSGSSDDELRGLLTSVFGAGGAIRRAISRTGSIIAAVFLLIAFGVGGFFLGRYLLGTTVAQYVPVAGGVLAAAGVFTAAVTRNRFRFIPLGLGIGLLLPWIINLIKG